MRTLFLALFFALPAFGGAGIESVYTDLSKCKPVGEPDDSGGDLPQVCQGPGKYTVALDFSAESTIVRVKHEDGFEVTVGSTLGVPGKMEWRTSNRVPFAVILRLRPEQKKEILAVIGLKDLPKLRHEVSSGKFMNDVARQTADKAFRQR